MRHVRPARLYRNKWIVVAGAIVGVLSAGVASAAGASSNLGASAAIAQAQSAVSSAQTALVGAQAALASAAAGLTAPSPSQTPTPSASQTPTASASQTPTPSPSQTRTPRPTASSTPTVTSTPAPSSTATGSPGARLFSATSLWNTVKTTSTFVSAADASLHSLTYGINNGAFAHPTYFAKASDPVTTFHLGAGWGHPATTITAPAPAGMVPTSGSDHVMTVLLADGTLLDMDSVSGSGTSFTATYYGTSDGVSGPGFGGTANSGSNGNAYYSIGTTAIGSPQAGGTILARDVAAGTINHALDIAFDYSDLGGNVAPAVSNDDGGATGFIPEGGLLLIPAGTPKPSGLSAMGSALWAAASTYGVYVTDQLSGGPMFYGDGSSAVDNAFNSSDFTAIGHALRLT